MPSSERFVLLCCCLIDRCVLCVCLHQVAVGVNGPIFALLGKKAGHKDVEIVDVFRSGGDLVGVLARSGNGKAIDGVDARGMKKRIASLTGSGGIKTRIKTLKGLRADKYADRLLAIVEADAKLGRMSKPVCVSPSVFLQQDYGDRCFSKAFTVEQGVYMACFVLFVCLFAFCFVCRSQGRWRCEAEGGLQLHGLWC